MSFYFPPGFYFQGDAEDVTRSRTAGLASLSPDASTEPTSAAVAFDPRLRGRGRWGRGLETRALTVSLTVFFSNHVLWCSGQTNILAVQMTIKSPASSMPGLSVCLSVCWRWRGEGGGSVGGSGE